MGNSIGAFATLLAASLESSFCHGLVLLNAAGRFEERQPGEAPARKQAESSRRWGVWRVGE